MLMFFSTCHLQMVPWKYWPTESRTAVETIQRWKISAAGVHDMQRGLRTMCEVCVCVCVCVCVVHVCVLNTVL